MTIPIYQVDAFTDQPFSGNPAGVCLLERPMDAAWMQSVATEMNVSETAFAVRRTDGDFDLRWFTPATEVDLCGHATLATSHVLYEVGRLTPHQPARYHTKSGLLQARQVHGRIELDFPATPPQACEEPVGLLHALGLDSAVWIGRSRFDAVVEVASVQLVGKLAPDFAHLRTLDVRGVMVTAASDQAEFQFVSRFFAPAVGINEDPVTGSAHCALTPYWAEKLGRVQLDALQMSPRTGRVHCTLAKDRVKLAGSAVTVLEGRLRV